MTNSDKFKQVFGLYATELWAMTETEFLAWLNADAKPERKNGKWLKTGQSFVFPDIFRNYFCSECGFEIEKTAYNYCPNCGAKMEVDHAEI